MTEQDPIPAWERRTRALSAAMALIAFAIVAALIWTAQPGWAPRSMSLAAAALVAAGLYFVFTRRLRSRRRLRAQPFPPAWGAILERDVAFYRALDETGRRRFRRELQVFLGEKRITGVRVEIDDTTRVLAGASAIIPVFGFPDWEWDQIEEILVYPSRFDDEYRLGDSPRHRTLGQVGTGALNRLMILSQPDLIQGFRQPEARRNVGIHEFVHLMDKTDGAIDGVPGLDRRAVGPWLELMRRKLLEMREGRSDIDLYGLTSPAEFFAVTSEYFFQQPERMQERHPELYSMLARVFRQDLRSRAREALPHRGLGATECPCGSGLRFKDCCRAQCDGA